MLYLADCTSYIFLNSCEKFDLNGRIWTNLDPMNAARWGFNPCLFQDYIYLCGYSTSIEAFSPHTEKFVCLTTTFPESKYCCLYVDGDFLVVRSVNYLVKYAGGAGGQLGETQRTQVAEMYVGQSSQPVVEQVSGCVYMVVLGKCVKFDMKTGLVRQ